MIPRSDAAAGSSAVVEELVVLLSVDNEDSIKDLELAVEVLLVEKRSGVVVVLVVELSVVEFNAPRIASELMLNAAAVTLIPLPLLLVLLILLVPAEANLGFVILTLPLMHEMCFPVEVSAKIVILTAT